MSLENKKLLFIIAQLNFRDEELEIPKKVLENEGARVLVASITKEEAIGMLGLKVKPDLAVKDANSEEFDALVIVGGSGSPRLADYPEVLNIVKRFEEKGKPIAAICLAPYVLAKAGVLKGKKVTCFPADFALAELRRAGANYVKEDVVVDGNLITAKGPEVAESFAKEIVKVLTSKN